MARRHTPYYHKFVALGAEMVDRIGFDSAFKFTSVEAEHMATRQRAGLYDVYYQVLLDVRGNDAERLLRRTLVNDVARLDVGKALYSSVCKPDGGMVDDLTCLRLGADHFWLCPTPSRVDTVAAWMEAHAAGMSAYVTNLRCGRAFISIQGPRARDVLSRLTDADLATATLPYYAWTRAVVADVPDTVISRTGYSGELGYELFYPGEYAEHMWDAVLAAGRPDGLVPCGLGALRSVRIEKRYPLYGLDLDETTSPLEAGLGWTVRFDNPDFIGRDALLRQRDRGVGRSLVLMEFPDLEFVPAPGDAVQVEGRNVGKVTSADRGYHLRKSLALGYVAPEAAKDGETVAIRRGADGATGRAVVRTSAPYDPERKRVRA
ncbi:MAG: glycine cleavage system aminomethyltransferase GcvT [Alphaproteobacteria bacterium]|nr:glycine cleavage system aminomethyltransferase GcvT [Alphaproteobacteria bacterium]